MPLGASFFEDVPLVEFIYLVFTRMPGRVTVSYSGLCCCVPCLSRRYYFSLFGDSSERKPEHIYKCLYLTFMCRAALTTDHYAR